MLVLESRTKLSLDHDAIRDYVGDVGVIVTGVGKVKSYSCMLKDSHIYDDIQIVDRYKLTRYCIIVKQYLTLLCSAAWNAGAE